jgi:hypothetical protein
MVPPPEGADVASGNILLSAGKCRLVDFPAILRTRFLVEPIFEIWFLI